jgi:hypothetical protein
MFPHADVSRLSVKFVESDEFGVVAGSGWVLTKGGKRLDWPMLTTHAQAVKDFLDLQMREAK